MAKNASRHHIAIRLVLGVLIAKMNFLIFFGFESAKTASEVVALENFIFDVRRDFARQRGSGAGRAGSAFIAVGTTRLF